jgi:hypothetical protein
MFCPLKGGDMKFRKKPVVIDAFQWSPQQEEQAPQWFKDALASRQIYYIDAGSINVKLGICVIGGRVTADSGDWVLRGVNGEFYPCTDDIFWKTYEQVSDDTN